MFEKSKEQSDREFLLPQPSLSRADVTWIALLTIVVTLFALQFSFARGRLTLPITDDDAGYFVDAAARLELWRAKGLRPLLSNYAALPPHAPLSTALGMTAFALFGLHDWAPYAANSLLVLAFLLVAARLTTDLPSLQRTFLLIFVGAMPISLLAVGEFRPDFGAGLFTAAGVVWTLSRPLRSASRGHLAISGLLFGLGLVAKPTFFPFTLLIWGCSGAANIAGEAWEHRSVVEVRRGLLRALLPVITGLGVSLGYFAFGLRDIVEYVRMSMFTNNADLWTIAGGWTEQMKYFVSGEGGGTVLGECVWLLLGLLLAGSVLVIARAAAGTRLQWISFLAVTFIAYGFVTANKVKGPLFGMTFHLLLIFGAVILLRRLAWHAGTMKIAQGAPTAFLAAIAGASIVLSGLRYQPTVWGVRGAPETRLAWKIQEDAFRVLDEQVTTTRRPRVFCTTLGAINQATLEWMTARDIGRDRFRFARKLHYWDDPALYRPVIDLSDVVIAAEPGATGLVSWLPSSHAAATTLAMVQNSPRFREIRRLPTPGGQSYVIFERWPMFDGWATTEGLLPLLEAEAASTEPDVRWGCGPETRLLPRASPGTHVTLHASAAGAPGQRMTISYGGRTLSQMEFPHREFIDHSVDFEVTSAEEPLVLMFSQWREHPKPQRAVRFKELRLVEHAPAFLHR